MEEKIYKTIKSKDGSIKSVYVGLKDGGLLLIKRDPNKHILRVNKSYGFNYNIIESMAKENGKIVVKEEGNDEYFLCVAATLIMKHKDVKQFEELQIFYPVKDFEKVPFEKINRNKFFIL